MSGAADKQQRAHIGMLMVASALMMAHQVAGKASRDAIFLSHFRTAALPAMVTVATITAVAASVVGSRTFVRLGPHRLAPASFALSGVVQIAEWFLLGYEGAHRGDAPSICTSPRSGRCFSPSFWSLMSESFEPRSAKAVFRKDRQGGYARRIMWRTIRGACSRMVRDEGSHAAACGPAPGVRWSALGR